VGRREPQDLLILDLKMPAIDGPTLYREILARWPTGGPRALCVSGFAGSRTAPLRRDIPTRTGTAMTTTLTAIYMETDSAAMTRIRRRTLGVISGRLGLGCIR
jgi:CheY-like chemotaxis protein